MKRARTENSCNVGRTTDTPPAIWPVGSTGNSEGNRSQYFLSPTGAPISLSALDVGNTGSQYSHSPSTRPIISSVGNTGLVGATGNTGPIGANTYGCGSSGSTGPLGVYVPHRLVGATGNTGPLRSGSHILGYFEGRNYIPIDHTFDHVSVTNSAGYYFDSNGVKRLYSVEGNDIVSYPVHVPEPPREVTLDDLLRM